MAQEDGENIALNSLNLYGILFVEALYSKIWKTEKGKLRAIEGRKAVRPAFHYAGMAGSRIFNA